MGISSLIHVIGTCTRASLITGRTQFDYLETKISHVSMPCAIKLGLILPVINEQYYDKCCIRIAFSKNPHKTFLQMYFDKRQVNIT